MSDLLHGSKTRKRAVALSQRQIPLANDIKFPELAEENRAYRMGYENGFAAGVLYAKKLIREGKVSVK